MHPKTWHIAEPVAKNITNPSCPKPELAAILLCNRDFNDANAIESFLNPQFERDIHDPFLFQDMTRVVNRINEAIKQKQNIVVYADYDADGVCSAVLLVSVLRELGANVSEVYLPHREKEGYGLNKKAIEQFIAAGANLLITLDCGTTNYEEIIFANEAHIDVIVIDHHHAPEHRPPAYAILNAKMPNESYPYKFLASVGVTFKTAQALLKERIKEHPHETERWQSYEKWLLDLVAIATVTDLVPLLGENRALLKYGLIVLNKTQRPGLKAIISAMGGALGSLDTYSVGFQIGPRLNAAGRMNHANSAYKLLQSSDTLEAENLAKLLEQENKNRQDKTNKITAEAFASLNGQENDWALVAVGENWPVGLVGLVASRLMEYYHRPVLVIGHNGHEFWGSGRSISSFNIIEALSSIADLFEKFGGHAQACGFTLKKGEDVNILRERLNELAHSKLKEDDLTPVINIEAVLSLREVNEELGEMLQLFEPFGMANPRPRFLFSNVRVVGLNRVGNEGKHLRLTLSDGGDTIRHAIGFNHGERGESIKLGDIIDVAAEVVLNEWNGRRDWQIRIIDFRQHVTA